MQKTRKLSLIISSFVSKICPHAADTINEPETGSKASTVDRWWTQGAPRGPKWGSTLVFYEAFATPPASPQGPLGGPPGTLGAPQDPPKSFRNGFAHPLKIICDLLEARNCKNINFDDKIWPPETPIQSLFTKDRANYAFDVKTCYFFG
jgi:hypothetical protein